MLDLAKSTLSHVKKRGELHRYTIQIKPVMNLKNKIDRACFALSFTKTNTCDAETIFKANDLFDKAI